MATRGGKQWKKNKLITILNNFQKYGRYTCEICKKAPLLRNGPGIKNYHPNLLTVDHIKELKNGGTHALINLRVACGKCNQARDHEDN